ncbi:MAG TPA: molybdate ABC transporter substrate-binding protein [Haliangium sp.]|nr:molybdate ABC transporter substrate-binding protein [Haliangium sp.]
MAPNQNHPRRRRRALLSLLSLLSLSCLLPACSEPRDTSTQDPGGQTSGSRTPAASGAPAAGPADQATAPARPASQELTIFAASSLREAFEAMARDFRRVHAGVEITFNFAGSQELRTQIEHGAPAHVFASADRKHMDALVTAGLVGPAALFARNHLVVVVPRDAPVVKTLSDLPKAQRVVIGAPEVPVGRYTSEVLARATAKWPGFEKAVMARVVSQELNVRQVLAKVTLGEADAGIVYRTDAATSADTIGVIALPQELDVVAEYPIAALASAPEIAQAWIDHVRSPAGREVLARFGFDPPAGDARPAAP